MSDFGESRSLSARGMVLLLLLAVLVGVVGLVAVLLLLLGGSTEMGGDFGPLPPESFTANELFTVAVSSVDAFVESGQIL